MISHQVRARKSSKSQKSKEQGHESMDPGAYMGTINGARLGARRQHRTFCNLHEDIPVSVLLARSCGMTENGMGKASGFDL